MRTINILNKSDVERLVKGKMLNEFKDIYKQIEDMNTRLNMLKEENIVLNTKLNNLGQKDGIDYV